MDEITAPPIWMPKTGAEKPRVAPESRAGLTRREKDGVLNEHHEDVGKEERDEEGGGRRGSEPGRGGNDQRENKEKRRAS